MRRHRHLYERVASFENLLAAARTALRGKRGRAPGATFFAALEWIQGRSTSRRSRSAAGPSSTR